MIDLKKINLYIVTLDNDYKALKESNLELCDCCKFQNVYGFSWSKLTRMVHGMFPDENSNAASNFYHRCYESIIMAKKFSVSEHVIMCATIKDFVDIINYVNGDNDNLKSN